MNGWIDGLTTANSTNWDRGIEQVAESGTRFDVAIVITDGNPTVYGNGQGPGNFTRLRELENGIFSANTVKAKATRMIALGVGAGVSGSPNNLISISGPTANSDYYQTNDYTAAGAALRALALGNCKGTISVVKQVVPSTAPAGSITGAVPAGGWQFGATTTTSGVAINPTSGATAAASGALNFNLTFPGGTTTAPVTVTETQQAGYTLVQQGGLNATCRRLDTNAAVTVTNSGATGFLVTAATTFPVSCTVYNRAPSPAATIVVNKKWLINGQSFDQGTQPSELRRRAHHRRHGAGLGCGADRLPAGRLDGAERDRQPPRTAVHADEQPGDVGQRHNRVRCAPVHGHVGRRRELLHRHQHGHLQHEADPGQGGARQRRAHRMDAQRRRAGRGRAGSERNDGRHRARDTRRRPTRSPRAVVTPATCRTSRQARCPSPDRRSAGAASRSMPRGSWSRASPTA